MRKNINELVNSISFGSFNFTEISLIFIIEKIITINKGKINTRLKNFSSNILIYFSIVSGFFSTRKEMSLLKKFLNIKLIGLVSVIK